MTSQGPADRAGLLDGLKLGAGTFTAIRVPPPNQVDQRSWKVALLTAPFWGAILGVLAAIPGLAGWWLAGQFDTRTGLAAVITGGLSMAAYVLLTRGLHLDGVADTFDGFGSARTGAAALAVMKDPALGALGGVAVVLVVLLQVAAWGQILTSGSAISGVLAVCAAMVLARAPLMWMTRAGTPAADTGLGRAVVGASGGGTAVVAGGSLDTGCRGSAGHRRCAVDHDRRGGSQRVGARRKAAASSDQPIRRSQR